MDKVFLLWKTERAGLRLCWVAGNYRTAHDWITQHCGKAVTTPQGRAERDGGRIRLRGTIGDDPRSWVVCEVSEHTVWTNDHRVKADPDPTAFFRWAQDQKTGVWYTHAEDQYPDGRYSLVPRDDGTFILYTYNLQFGSYADVLGVGIGLEEAARLVETLPR